MEKQRFSLLLRPTEHAVLRALASETDRSQGATVRFLIRAEAQRRGLWPRGQPTLTDTAHAPAQHGTR